jgi:hypothetical protein
MPLSNMANHCPLLLLLLLLLQDRGRARLSLSAAMFISHAT